MKTNIFLIVICTLSISLLLSCDNSTSSINPENSKVNNLVEVKWELSLFKAEDGTTITLNANESYNILFAYNDTLSGKADCNTYFSKFSAKDGGEIAIDLIHSTEVGCKETSNIDKYYESLSLTNVYEVNNILLKLGFGEKGILQFVKK